KKSLKGWKILLPSAGGRVNLPPFNDVPAGAVTSVRTWQLAQPMSSKISEPCSAAMVPARSRSRGGALVARINVANWSMSSEVLFGSAMPCELHSVVTSPDALRDRSCFENIYVENLPVDYSAGVKLLLFGNLDQLLIRHRFDKPSPKVLSDMRSVRTYSKAGTC